VTGHTHEVVNEVRNGVLQLNPGECCGWVTDRCTVALLDTDALEAQIVEVHP
jgi:predicted phosphodiesterase